MPILEHWLVYLALSGPAAASVPPAAPDAMETKACPTAKAPSSSSAKSRARADMPSVSTTTQRRTSL